VLKRDASYEGTLLVYSTVIFSKRYFHVLKRRRCQKTHIYVPAHYLIMAYRRSVNLQTSFVIYHQILKKKKRKNFPLLISWPFVPYIDNIRVVSALTKRALAIFYKNSRRNLSEVSNLSQILYSLLSLLLIFSFAHHLFHIASAIREPSRRAMWSQTEWEGNMVSQKFVMVFLFVPYRLLFRRKLLAWQRRLVGSTFSSS
jgi:hypothetical protein